MTPRSHSQPYAVPATYAKAVTNTAGTDFSNVASSPGFCAPSDYGPTIYVDAALANTSSPLVPDDNKADVAAAAAPVADKGNTAARTGDGLPFVYRKQSRADDAANKFPTQRVNAGGWVRPASDISIDGANATGTAFRSSPTKVVNATNGESMLAAAFSSGYYGTDGGSEVYAFHPGGAHAVFGDGSTKLIASDVLWSDPSTHAGLHPNTARCVGTTFGPDVTEVRAGAGCGRAPALHVVGAQLLAVEAGGLTLRSCLHRVCVRAGLPVPQRPQAHPPQP